MDDLSDLMGMMAALGGTASRLPGDSGAVVMMPGARVPFVLAPIQPGDADGLYDCPRCTDAVVDLLGHLAWCQE